MERKKSHKSFLPLINRGTYTRVHCIKNTIIKILTMIKERTPTAHVNIINMGSGLDTLNLHLHQMKKESDKFPSFSQYEFDYTDISKKKIDLISKSSLIHNLLGDDAQIINGSNIISKDYSIIDCDLTDCDKLKEKFCELKLNPDDLTILIAECLLVYIHKETTYKMLNEFTSYFSNLIFLQYDLIGAQDGFGQEMIENLLNREIKLFGYEEVPDIKAQTERLKHTGFKQFEVLDMLDYYSLCIATEERKYVEHLEMMDEFEEWNLMQQHACYGYGTKLENHFDYLNNILKLK